MNYIITEKGILVIPVQEKGTYTFEPNGIIRIEKNIGNERITIQINYKSSDRLDGQPHYNAYRECDKSIEVMGGVMTFECKEEIIVEAFEEAMSEFSALGIPVPENLAETFAYANNTLCDRIARKDEIANKAKEHFVPLQ